MSSARLFTLKKKKKSVLKNKCRAKDRKGSTADWVTHPLKRDVRFQLSISYHKTENENSGIVRFTGCTAVARI